MMRSHILLSSALALLLGTIAIAQPRPIFDPDDFVDPRQHAGPVFISRLVLGAALNPIDDYRPLHQNTGFVSLTNSLFCSRVQFHYKHSANPGADHHGDIAPTQCAS